MGRAQLVAAVIVAIVVTAVVTTLLAIPALYAHLRGEYRETVTTTQTVTVTEAPTAPIDRDFAVLQSRGTCGTLESPELDYVRVVDYVLLIYREQADTPCYRHVMPQVILRPIWPPLIDITLELERTSDICVECTGVIETIIRVGSLRGPGNVTTVPDGTKITVNGLETVVSGMSSWLVSPTVFLNQTVKIPMSPFDQPSVTDYPLRAAEGTLPTYIQIQLARGQAIVRLDRSMSETKRGVDDDQGTDRQLENQQASAKIGVQLIDRYLNGHWYVFYSCSRIRCHSFRLAWSLWSIASQKSV